MYIPKKKSFPKVCFLWRRRQPHTTRTYSAYMQAPRHYVCRDSTCSPLLVGFIISDIPALKQTCARYISSSPAALHLAMRRPSSSPPSVGTVLTPRVRLTQSPRVLFVGCRSGSSGGWWRRRRRRGGSSGRGSSRLSRRRGGAQRGGSSCGRCRCSRGNGFLNKRHHSEDTEHCCHSKPRLQARSCEDCKQSTELRLQPQTVLGCHHENTRAADDCAALLVGENGLHRRQV